MCCVRACMCVCVCVRARCACVRVQEAKREKVAIHKIGPSHLHFYWGATFHDFYRCFHPLSLYWIYIYLTKKKSN